MVCLTLTNIILKKTETAAFQERTIWTFDPQKKRMKPIKRKHWKEHSLIPHFIFQWVEGTDGLVISNRTRFLAAMFASFLAKPLKYPNPNALRMYLDVSILTWFQFWVHSISRAIACLILSKHVQPTKCSIKRQTPTWLFVITVVFLRRRKKQGTNHHMWS